MDPEPALKSESTGPARLASSQEKKKSKVGKESEEGSASPENALEIHKIQIDPVTEIQLKIRGVIKNNLAKTNMVQNLREHYLHFIYKQ